VKTTNNKTYIAKSIIQALDHFLKKIENEDLEIVIKIKSNKEEKE